MELNPKYSTCFVRSFFSRFPEIELRASNPEDYDQKRIDELFDFGKDLFLRYIAATPHSDSTMPFPEFDRPCWFHDWLKKMWVNSNSVTWLSSEFTNRFNDLYQCNPPSNDRISIDIGEMYSFMNGYLRAYLDSAYSCKWFCPKLFVPNKGDSVDAVAYFFDQYNSYFYGNDGGVNHTACILLFVDLCSIFGVDGCSLEVYDQTSLADFKLRTNEAVNPGDILYYGGWDLSAHGQGTKQANVQIIPWMFRVVYYTLDGTRKSMDLDNMWAVKCVESIGAGEALVFTNHHDPAFLTSSSTSSSDFKNRLVPLSAQRAQAQVEFATLFKCFEDLPSLSSALEVAKFRKRYREEIVPEVLELNNRLKD